MDYRMNPRMRQAFSNQCAQCLIIDLNNLNSDYLKNVVDALKHILSIGCSIRGGIRIPAFDLSILTGIHTKIYEMDAIKGNFNKVMFGLNDLPNYCQINDIINNQDYKDNLFLAINSAIQSFKITENHEWKFHVPKIEITIISTKNNEIIQEEIESFIENMEVSKIHKIKIIELKNMEDNDLNMETREENIAFIQTITLKGNSYIQIKEYLKRWLIDQSPDIDAILHFPGNPSNHLSIKCDLQECIINPLSLPFGHRFNIQVDTLAIQFNGASLSSNLQIFELNIISRVNSSSVCESSLFGLPHCLTPSKSWRLSWEEQNMNEEYFIELCRQLADDEKFLLAKLFTTYQTDQFLPYFILQPGTVPAECSSRIYSNLQHLEEIDNIENVNYDSGLLNTLVSNLEHAKNRNSTDEEPSTSKNKRPRRSYNKTKF